MCFILFSYMIIHKNEYKESVRNKINVQMEEKEIIHLD